MDGLSTENTGVVSIDGATTPESGGMQSFTGFYKEGGSGLLPAAEALKNQFLIERTSAFLNKDEPPKVEQQPATTTETVTVVNGFGVPTQVSDAKAEEFWNKEQPSKNVVSTSPEGQVWDKISSLEPTIEQQIVNNADGATGTPVIDSDKAVAGITLAETDFKATVTEDRAIELSGGENGANGIKSFEAPF